MAQLTGVIGTMSEFSQDRHQLDFDQGDVAVLRSVMDNMYGMVALMTEDGREHVLDAVQTLTNARKHSVALADHHNSTESHSDQPTSGVPALAIEPDVPECETGRRRHLTRSVAISSDKQGTDDCRIDATKADIDKRANDAAHHLMAKRRRRDLESHEWRIVRPGPGR